MALTQITPYSVFEGMPARIDSRERRLKETLQTVNVISSLAGNELPIHSVRGVEDINTIPGVYVLSDQEPGAEQPRISDVNFTPRPELLSGVADSAHTVIAGNLDIDIRGQGEVKPIPVAVKCFAKRTFEDRFQRACQEITIMRERRESGNLSMEPVALVVAPDNGQTHAEVVLVTKYDRGLLTLDNMAWGRGISSPANVSSAASAARALGEFNANGFLHGDAKVKNVAQDEEGGRMGMIDYETSQHIDPMNPAQAGLAAYMDFGLFVSSLADKGFCSSLQNPEERKVADTVAEAYLSSWDSKPSEVQEAAAGGVIEALQTLVKTQN